MKKTFLFFFVLAFIASGCGNKKATFDLATFPSEWRSLIDNNGEWVALDSPFSVIQIIGNNKLIEHYCVRVDETGYEETDSEYEILEVRQIGDTIVFNLKDKTYGGEYVYKFLWINEETGVGEWIFAGERGSEAYVVREREAEKFAKNQTTKKVKYYFKAYEANNDERKIVFFDDGTVCWGCELGEVRKNETAEYYSEHFDRNCLIVGKLEDYPLFDDFGYLHEGWQIFNFYKVNSRMQITNFEEETAKISAKDIQAINETCLIFITPENGYEEWVLYRDDREKEYAEKGIHSVDAQKKYLSFTLYDDERVIIDTKKKQNGTISPSALLYRKGYIPIMISISGESDEGNEMIEEYLRESGDKE
jgi:hypothetical protein